MSDERPHGSTTVHRPAPSSSTDAEVRNWIREITSGDRQALGRAITLVESSRKEDREVARRLVEQCLPLSGRSIRIGVSGLPGAGKSTLIDRLGCLIVAQDRRVAVLTVDPTSERTGGSVLGDKTRMESLARRDAAFVRPSPSRGALGGVGARTREAILVCEAAGYDVVIVETVGVGQSELDVSRLVDFLMLMVTSGGGDELQGIKRGVIEFADLILVSKADGSNEVAALETAEMYRSVVQLFPGDESGWRSDVLAVSSFSGAGVEQIWRQVLLYHSEMIDSGYLDTKRTAQAVHWMRAAIDEELRVRFLSHEHARKVIAEHEALVRAGKESPVTGAENVIAEIVRSR